MIATIQVVLLFCLSLIVLGYLALIYVFGRRERTADDRVPRLEHSRRKALPAPRSGRSSNSRALRLYERKSPVAEKVRDWAAAVATIGALLGLSASGGTMLEFILAGLGLK
jgi:hypothetical protein